MDERDYKITDEDVERFIERQLIVTLRTMFTLDEKYNYSTDDSKSEFTITTDFPMRDIPEKETGIAVTGISYTFNLQTTLGQNFSEEIFAKDSKDRSVLVGERYRMVVPFNCTVICQGEANYIKDLANKVANILCFTGKKIIEILGITIYNISKGSCQPKTQTPAKVFQIPINVSGCVTWEGSHRYIDPDKMNNLLKEIQINFIMERYPDLPYNKPDVYINN